MSVASSVFDDGRTYAVAGLVNRGAGLALVPLFAHVLSPADFGLYAIIQSLTDLLSVMCGLGLSGAMNRFYLDFPADGDSRDRVVASVLVLVSAIAAAMAIMAWPLASLLAKWALGTEQHRELLMIAVVGLGFNALFEVESAYAIVRQRAGLYFAMSLAKAVMLIAANALLVFHWRMGVRGIVLATALAIGTVAIVAMVVILRRTGLRVSRPLLWRLLGYGLPLVPATLGNSALGLIERYYLNAAAGAGAVGFYSLANRIASLLQMFIAAPFSQTYTVRRMATMVNGEDQSPYDRILMLFVTLMSISALAMSVFGTDLVALIASADYQPAVRLIPLLGLCYVLASVNFHLELGIHYSKQTWVFPVITLATLAAGVVLNRWLSPLYGAIGAALSLLGVNLVRIAATLALNQRFGSSHVRLDWFRVGLVMGCSLAGGLAWLVVDAPPLQPGWIALKLAWVLLAAAIVVASPLLDPASRSDLRELWRRAPPSKGPD